MSQFLTLFGFFALVLVSIYWVNRAVILFDRLIADGQSASVFFEFTALSLPNVIRLVLPMASFAATTYVANRLINESELVVVQATGFSPLRLIRPVMFFGIIVALMMSVLTHFLVPTSLATLTQREQELKENVSARLLREGLFFHPSRGITFYIRDIAKDGELSDIFLSDERSPSRSVTYTANSAYLVKTETGTQLVMLDGLVQIVDKETKNLSTTQFSDFSYDVSQFIANDTKKPRSHKHVPTLDLILHSKAIANETGISQGRALEEGHGRFQQALLCLVAAMVGFSALLTGSFSRFGVGRQIMLAIFILVLIKLVESAVTAPVRGNPALWPLAYAPSFFGLCVSLLFIRSAARVNRPQLAWRFSKGTAA